MHGDECVETTETYIFFLSKLEGETAIPPNKIGPDKPQETIRFNAKIPHAFSKMVCNKEKIEGIQFILLVLQVERLELVLLESD